MTMWIEPATFTPQTDEVVPIKLRLGDTPHQATAVLRSKAHILRFMHDTGEEQQPVVGRDGADPAGIVRLQVRGLQSIAYESTASFIELDAQKFNSYLEHVGLDSVLDFRIQHDEEDKNGTEAYSRSLKSLIQVGPPTGQDRIAV